MEFFLYLAIGTVVLVFLLILIALVKAADLIVVFSNKLSSGWGIIFILVYFALHLLAVFFIEKSEDAKESWFEIIKEIAEMCITNTPLIGFFVFYIIPVGNNIEITDILQGVIVSLGTFLALVLHIGLWTIYVGFICKDKITIKGLVIRGVVYPLVIISIDYILTGGELALCYPILGKIVEALGNVIIFLLSYYN